MTHSANVAIDAVRVIALYLPQFHPIPENDEWWGKGFTEWTNTAKARPLFRGHIQPHLPADLGFYDLRVPETRIAQAELAREHGVGGFCYWHYWFAGKRLLERPFNEVLCSGEPDFPFCLGWANETWTGIWHGTPGRILIEQTHPGIEDYRRHFEVVREAFEDPRYMTVDGKPIFMVYKPHNLPNSLEFTDCWRNLAKSVGLEGLYLIGFADHNWIPEEHGFDASAADHALLCTETALSGPRKFVNRLSRRLTGQTSSQLQSRIRPKPRIYAYKDYVKHVYDMEPKALFRHPTVMPGWDNTPRSGTRGVVLQGTSPELFRLHLQGALARVVQETADRRIIILKSWNEWAEGNYMEPDMEHGSRYLEVLREVIANGVRS